jgi:hypothetical protein
MSFRPEQIGEVLWEDREYTTERGFVGMVVYEKVRFATKDSYGAETSWTMYEMSVDMGT